jgi:carbonic anhydrase
LVGPHTRGLQMHRLIEGFSRFRRESFTRHRGRFRALAARQSPEALLITCSDSRIVPGIIFDSAPGELFVIRNAGNIVPPHDGTPSGESATIEYALEVLRVPHVVVCGHTDCGAMRGAMDPEKLGALNAVRAWLRHAPTPEETKATGDEHQRLRAIIERNVLTQIANLRTYPFVESRIRSQELQIHGGVFDIESATFSTLDPSKGTFAPLPQTVESPSTTRGVAHV